jgi:enoyl-CoA hydratase/carnithine racemase
MVNRAPGRTYDAAVNVSRPASVSPWNFEVEDEVAIASYHRPPRNLMRFGDMEQLRPWLESVAANPGIGAVMVRSDLAGYFIAHADLEDLVALGEGRPASGDPRIWYRTLRFIEEMPQPVVAAIDGQAWGGGFELALACAMRLATEVSSFRFLEVDLGLMPGAGGVQRVTRIAGAGRAADLVLNGAAVTAADALTMGLVSTVLPEQGFDSAARQWCGRLAAKPRRALFAAKKALVAGLYAGYDEALRNDGRTFATLMADPEALELERATIERYRIEPPR